MRKILVYVAAACIIANMVLLVIVFAGRPSPKPAPANPANSSSPTNTIAADPGSNHIVPKSTHE